MDNRPSVVLSALMALERATNPNFRQSAYSYNQQTGRYQVLEGGTRRTLSDTQTHELLTAANRVIARVNTNTAGQDAYDNAARGAPNTPGAAFRVPVVVWVALGAVVLAVAMRRRK